MRNKQFPTKYIRKNERRRWGHNPKFPATYDELIEGFPVQHFPNQSNLQTFYYIGTYYCIKHCVYCLFFLQKLPEQSQDHRHLGWSHNPGSESWFLESKTRSAHDDYAEFYDTIMSRRCAVPKGVAISQC